MSEVREPFDRGDTGNHAKVMLKKCSCLACQVCRIGDIYMEFITIGAVSHPGLKRSDNQDHYAYYFPEEDIADTKGILMTVADGMGGHAAGAIASGLAVDVLMTEYYDAESSTSITESLKNAFLKANQEVMARGQDDRKLQGMGTTMTAVVVVNNKMYYAHVGDSRGL
jgi:protein phosphatase